MSYVFNSSSFIVANCIKEYILGLNLGFYPSVLVSDQYIISNNNSLNAIISPLTTVIGGDAKDIVRERVATQIIVAKRVGRQISDVDAIINKVEELQKKLYFFKAVANNLFWVTDQVELNGTIITAGGEKMDGIYDSEDLGDAGVFKTSLIVASSRFLKVV